MAGLVKDGTSELYSWLDFVTRSDLCREKNKMQVDFSENICQIRRQRYLTCVVAH